MSNFEYGNPGDSEEMKRLGAILAQCFIGSSQKEGKYLNLIGSENIRTIRQGNRIIGGLGTIPMSQWWGGKKVSMTGIGGVGITPEYRGSGAAVILMQEVIKELYNRGVSTSALYPAVQRLYRKVGYEQAGSYCGWEIPVHSLDVAKELNHQLLPVISVNLQEDKQKNKSIHQLYLKQAQSINGHLERHSFNWYKILNSSNEDTIYAYLFGSLEKPEGYVIFKQYRQEDYSFITVLDWVILTSKAAYTFWNLVKNHSSQINKLQWQSSPIDLLTLLVPQQDAKLVHSMRWMLRIVNVIQALSERGYPTNLDTELHLQVEDDIIPENNGKFILQIKDGCTQVTRGGRGEMSLDINALATMYSGLFSPHQLQVLGKLDAPSIVLDNANQVFSGTTPWMKDFF